MIFMEKKYKIHVKKINGTKKPKLSKYPLGTFMETFDFSDKK